MGFVPKELERLRPPNTMGHKTRSKWSNRQENGTTPYTASTAYTRPYTPYTYDPRENDPTYDLPIKRIKRTAGILLILFLLWALSKLLGW